LQEGRQLVVWTRTATYGLRLALEERMGSYQRALQVVYDEADVPPSSVWARCAEHPEMAQRDPLLVGPGVYWVDQLAAAREAVWREFVRRLSEHAHSCEPWQRPLVVLALPGVGRDGLDGLNVALRCGSRMLGTGDITVVAHHAATDAGMPEGTARQLAVTLSVEVASLVLPDAAALDLAAEIVGLPPDACDSVTALLELMARVAPASVKALSDAAHAVERALWRAQVAVLLPALDPQRSRELTRGCSRKLTH
jgi:hypothetical protein